MKNAVDTLNIREADLLHAVIFEWIACIGQHLEYATGLYPLLSRERTQVKRY